VGIEVEAGAMRPMNGSALICAGAISVLVFPLIGDMLVRKKSRSRGVDALQNDARGHSSVE